MTTENSVWVLGAINRNADKSISWDQPFPNFADPDAIIINLTSLTEDVLERIDKAKLSEARETIFHKFLGGGTLIFITSREKSAEIDPYKLLPKTVKFPVPQPVPVYSNYFLSPVQLRAVNVKEGANVKVPKLQSHYLAKYFAYLSRVKRFDFFLHNFLLSPSIAEITPNNEVTSRLVHWLSEEDTDLKYHFKTYPLATDNSGNILSAACQIVSGNWLTGFSIYLPPLTGASVEESIDILLEDVFGRSYLKETLPEWVYSINLRGFIELTKTVEQLYEKKRKLVAEIQEAETKKRVVQNYYRLLASKGAALEDAVYESFRLLGFDDISKKRGLDKEDWIFQFKNIAQYKYGIIEVKGSDTGTTLQNLLQCNKWVDDYVGEFEELVKGIFVANQFRLKPYPESKNSRKQFDSTHEKYAKMHNICIIPSYVLFEAANEALGNLRKPREHLEELISGCSGVLTQIT